MEKIYLIARFAVQNGKTAEFKRIAEQCIEAVIKYELGKTCYQYDWFFSDDDKECHVIEAYSNSNAVMAHMGNVGELLGQLAQFSSLSGEIYGSISDELKAALQGADIKVFNSFKGA